MDVGASTLSLWAFEEWEKLLEFYERVSGARMHASFIRPGRVAQDLPLGLCQDIDCFTHQFASCIDGLEEVSTGNQVVRHEEIDSNMGGVPIWQQRFYLTLLKHAYYVSEDLGDNVSERMCVSPVKHDYSRQGGPPTFEWCWSYGP
ncbi:hypothetical protein JHK85_040149 [Glycine max]|nr:hypothetical protein JHK86_039571 [Glycine max]KAG4965174.1 hypothetical protein JHK85_040149 [Glycine max]